MARDQHKMEKRGFKAVGDTKKKKKKSLKGGVKRRVDERDVFKTSRRPCDAPPCSSSVVVVILHLC